MKTSGPSIRFLAWLMRDSARRGCTLASSTPELPQRLLDDGELVGGVVDDEVAGQADVRRLAAQQPRAQRVKGRDPHLPAVDAEQRLDARAHLLRGLVGEGDRQDAIRRADVAADEVGDAVRDDARLARARAREDQERAVGLKNSFLLFGIEGGEKIHSPLFYRDALREVPRLIDVAAAAHGDVVREQLQRDRHDDRREQRRRRRHRQVDVVGVEHAAIRLSPSVVIAITDPPRALASCTLPIIFSNT